MGYAADFKLYSEIQPLAPGVENAGAERVGIPVSEGRRVQWSIGLGGVSFLIGTVLLLAV